jgi:hypothetical protein
MLTTSVVESWRSGWPKTTAPSLPPAGRIPAFLAEGTMVSKRQALGMVGGALLLCGGVGHAQSANDYGQQTKQAAESAEQGAKSEADKMKGSLQDTTEAGQQKADEAGKAAEQKATETQEAGKQKATEAQKSAEEKAAETQEAGKQKATEAQKAGEQKADQAKKKAGEATGQPAEPTPP